MRLNQKVLRETYAHAQRHNRALRLPVKKLIVRGAKYNNDHLLSYCLQPSKWGMATGMFSSVLDKRYFVHLGNDRCLLNFWALFILIAVSH